MPKGLEPVVDNAPILSYHHAGMTVEGYSRAAVQRFGTLMRANKCGEATALSG